LKEFAPISGELFLRDFESCKEVLVKLIYPFVSKNECDHVQSFKTSTTLENHLQKEHSLTKSFSTEISGKMHSSALEHVRILSLRFILFF